MAVLGERGAVFQDPFDGNCFHQTLSLKVCDLSAENTACLMSLFPYTKPVALKKYPTTIGTGDRLGVAGPGHIRAVRPYRARPVLAQQSVRENTQTGRDFPAVVRAAAWAVFQEDYRGGYGADGDHLKSLDQISGALRAGVSMITLDLSEQLYPKAFQLSREAADREFLQAVPAVERQALTRLLGGREFRFAGRRGEFAIRFDPEAIARNALLFRRALEFTEEACRRVSSTAGAEGPADFEISVDETPFATSPESHLFFVLLLKERGIGIDSLAPRFVGEFQKGIDYRGDTEAFRDHFYRHSVIARHNGDYKISVHSGSDKFSVFPHIGEMAEGGLHVKTSGTSWLEAVRLIALRTPSLYRNMHRFALGKFEEASRLYEVTTDIRRVPPLESLQDRDLPALLDRDDSRQLLHLTYGFLLNAGEEGKSLFREGIDRALAGDEETYWALLEKHIGRHLDFLGVKRESATREEGER